MGPKHIFLQTSDQIRVSCINNREFSAEMIVSFARKSKFFQVFQSLSSPYLRLKFHPVFFLKTVRPEKAKQPNEHACYGLTLK